MTGQAHFAIDPAKRTRIGQIRLIHADKIR
jgi:hypothetical protein